MVQIYYMVSQIITFMVSQIITFIVRMLLHLWLVLHLRLIIAFMGDTKGLKGQYYYKLARIFRNVGGQT